MYHIRRVNLDTTKTQNKNTMPVTWGLTNSRADVHFIGFWTTIICSFGLKIH